MRSASSRGNADGADHEADRGDHVEIGAGQRAVVECRLAAAARDRCGRCRRDRGEIGADGRHGVGDGKMRPGAALARSAASMAPGWTWKPSVIRPHQTSCGLERRADQAGAAMAELAHRVEEMGDEAGAGREGVARHLVGCIGMADRDMQCRPRRGGRSASAVAPSRRRPWSARGRCPVEPRAARDRLPPSGGSASGHGRPCGRPRDAGPRYANAEAARHALRRWRRARLRSPAPVTAGVSVIRVGSSAVVPKRAWAAQMVRMPSTACRARSAAPAAAVAPAGRRSPAPAARRGSSIDSAASGSSPGAATATTRSALDQNGAPAETARARRRCRRRYRR